MAEKTKGRQSLFKLVITIIVVIIIFRFVSNLIANAAKDFYTPGTYSVEWDGESNIAEDPEEADPGSSVPVAGERAKYTKLLGGGRDQCTIMVYMCGTDLESQASMASMDLQEMAAARFGKNVNLIVYTGGCKKWHTEGISSKYNEILQVSGDGNVYVLNSNAGTSSMVNPENLTDFIEYCTSEFEANRYGLIFWDHGGGTISGYGYDEKYPNSGSMTLELIDSALTNAGTKFDFIGFDACLMATAETAVMLSEHADYMIASEEAEPGIGWYYTTWLDQLGKNTSIPTTELGKTIVDSFVSKCKTDVPRQSATLSVVDLAAAQALLPSAISAFAKDTTELIEGGSYNAVSSARGKSREFGTSAGVDMVDLVDFASKVNSESSKDLKAALLKCIKYNNVSSDMSNSYGLSIYFPYRSPSYVNTVLNTYKSINMDSGYSECIKSFASYQTSGQIVSGGSHNAYESFGSFDADDYYGGYGSEEDILNLLEGFLSIYGGYGGTSQGNDYYNDYYDYFSDDSYSDYGSDDWGWLFDYYTTGRGIPSFINQNHFDADLNWKDGKIAITQEQWDMVSELLLNVFIDDGNGYIDLGTDNVYDIDKKGNLLAQEELTWLGVSSDGNSWQVVPYYYISSLQDGDNIISTGRIPVLLNGQLADIIIKLDDNGISAVGARLCYRDNQTVAKSITALKDGDEIEFVCDYYGYDGSFCNTYVLGSKLVLNGELLLGDCDISSEKSVAAYRITDIYRQHYWTPDMNSGK